MASDTTYRRNFAGFWTRNGKPVKSVPDHVAMLARTMAMECTVTVPSRGR